MYTQFFGSFLLQKDVVTTDQLLEAISTLNSNRLRIGTLAIHKGLMTSAEVDECCFLQTRMDKRFGEIAIERGYLTEEQLSDLLKSQEPDFLILGQTLVENQVISNSELERLIFEYQAENELYELEVSIENKDRVQELIEKFFYVAETPFTENTIMYLNLMFNNLIRFIGDDFTPLLPIECTEYPTNYAVGQNISGHVSYMTHIDMDEATAIAFASRYAKEEFYEFDEYVQASIEDFLNLHNGLFVVNVSNDSSMEMMLEPPVVEENTVLDIPTNCVVIPVIYPFGTIHLLVTF